MKENVKLSERVKSHVSQLPLVHCHAVCILVCGGPLASELAVLPAKRGRIVRVSLG